MGPLYAVLAFISLLAAVYFVIKSREFRKFLSGAFFMSAGIQFYLYLTGVSLPLWGTDFVQTPHISAGRACLHLAFFLLTFYFGFIRKAYRRALHCEDTLLPSKQYMSSHNPGYSTTSQFPPGPPQPDPGERNSSAVPPTVSILKLAVTALYLALWSSLVLILAGDWRWVQGWIFGGWFLLLSASTIIWLFRKDPALLAERYRRPGTGGQSARDKAFTYLLLIGYAGWMVLMPLDARRFRWTAPTPLALQVAGGALLAFSWLFWFRSFTDNTFLSPLVRVQKERDHQVVSTGVYGFVRHPMYLGVALMLLGGPLLLGAASAFVCGLALILLLAVRILDEEKLLVAELPGYDEYQRRVRYRLLPRVW